MHYCRLRHWGNQAKIAEIQGIPGAHEEHMCTAVLTHFPIYTQTHSRLVQVYVPWDLSQDSHTLHDIYTCMNIYRYLCIDCMCIFTCSMAGTGILPKIYPSWTRNLSLCGRGSSGHHYSATATCTWYSPLSPNSTQGTAMLLCFSVFIY